MYFSIRKTIIDTNFNIFFYKFVFLYKHKGEDRSTTTAATTHLASTTTTTTLKTITKPKTTKQSFGCE